jgi:hypothetical protein
MAGRRLLHAILGAASREIRSELREGATWADAHLVCAEPGKAVAVVDTSLGFSMERHPDRGSSPSPPTTIVVVVA